VRRGRVCPYSISGASADHSRHALHIKQRKEIEVIGTQAQLNAAQHAYDNRAEPEVDDIAEGLMYLIESAEELIGRAERCIANGDFSAAIDLLQSAGKELTEAGYA
jgi:hypothetical protein